MHADASGSLRVLDDLIGGDQILLMVLNHPADIGFIHVIVGERNLFPILIRVSDVLEIICAPIAVCALSLMIRIRSASFALRGSSQACARFFSVLFPLCTKTLSISQMIPLIMTFSVFFNWGEDSGGNLIQMAEENARIVPEPISHDDYTAIRLMPAEV